MPSVSLLAHVLSFRRRYQDAGEMKTCAPSQCVSLISRSSPTLPSFFFFLHEASHTFATFSKASRALAPTSAFPRLLPPSLPPSFSPFIRVSISQHLNSLQKKRSEKLSLEYRPYSGGGGEMRRDETRAGKEKSARRE